MESREGGRVKNGCVLSFTPSHHIYSLLIKIMQSRECGGVKNGVLLPPPHLLNIGQGYVI